MIVADAIWEGSSGTSDSFGITLPSDFVFYERSYSLYCSQGSSYGGSGMEIDDDRVGYLSDTGTDYDFLSPSQLSQEASHTIELIKYTNQYYADVFDAIVLIYQEP